MKNPASGSSHTVLNDTQCVIVASYYEVYVEQFCDALFSACKDENQTLVCLKMLDTARHCTQAYFKPLVKEHFPNNSGNHIQIRHSLNEINQLISGEINSNHLFIQQVCDERLHINVEALKPENAIKYIAETFKNAVGGWLEIHYPSLEVPYRNKKNYSSEEKNMSSPSQSMSR